MFTDWLNGDLLSTTEGLYFGILVLFMISGYLSERRHTRLLEKLEKIDEGLKQDRLHMEGLQAQISGLER